MTLLTSATAAATTTTVADNVDVDEITQQYNGHSHMHVQDEMEYLELLETMNEQFDLMEEQDHAHMAKGWNKRNERMVMNKNVVSFMGSRSSSVSSSLQNGPVKRIFRSTESWEFAALLDSSTDASETHDHDEHSTNHSLESDENEYSGIVKSSISENEASEVKVERIQNGLTAQAEKDNTEEIDESNDDDDHSESLGKRITVPVEMTPSPRPQQQEQQEQQQLNSLSDSLSNKYIGKEIEPAVLLNQEIPVNLTIPVNDSYSSERNAMPINEMHPGSGNQHMPVLDKPFFIYKRPTDPDVQRILASGRGMAGPIIRTKMNMGREFGNRKTLVTRAVQPSIDEEQASGGEDSGNNDDNAERQDKSAGSTDENTVSVPIKVYERPHDTHLQDNAASTGDAENEAADPYDKPLRKIVRETSPRPAKASQTDGEEETPFRPSGARGGNPSKPQRQSRNVIIRASLVLDGEKRPLRVSTSVPTKDSPIHNVDKQGTSISVAERKKNLDRQRGEDARRRKQERRDAIAARSRRAIQRRRQLASSQRQRQKLRFYVSDSESSSSFLSSSSSASLSSNSSVESEISEDFQFKELEQYKSKLRTVTANAQKEAKRQFGYVQEMAKRAVDRVTNLAKLDSQIRAQMEAGADQAKKLVETVLQAEKGAMAKIQESKQRLEEGRAQQVMARVFGELPDPSDEFSHLLTPPNWTELDDKAELSTIEDGGEQILKELEEHRKNIAELVGEFDARAFKEDIAALLQKKEEIFSALSTSKDDSSDTMQVDTIKDDFREIWESVMSVPLHLPMEPVERHSEEITEDDAIRILEQVTNGNTQPSLSEGYPNIVEHILEFSVLNRAKKLAEIVIPSKEPVAAEEEKDGTTKVEKEDEVISTGEGEKMKDIETAPSEQEDFSQAPATSAPLDARVQTSDPQVSEDEEDEEKREVKEERPSQNQEQKQEQPPAQEPESVERIRLGWGSQHVGNPTLHDLQRQIELERREASTSTLSPQSPPSKEPLLRTGIHKLAAKPADNNEVTSASPRSKLGFMYKNHTLPRMVKDDTLHETPSNQRALVLERQTEDEDEETLQTELHRLVEQAICAVSHEILHHVISQRDAAMANALEAELKQLSEHRQQYPQLRINIFSPELLQFCINNGIALDGEELKGIVAEVIRDAMASMTPKDGQNEGQTEEVSDAAVSEREIDPLEDEDPVDTITEGVYKDIYSVILQLMLQNWDTLPEPKIEEVSTVEETVSVSASSEESIPEVSEEEEESEEEKEVEEKPMQQRKKESYLESVFAVLRDREGLFFLTDRETFALGAAGAISAVNQHIRNEAESRPSVADMDVQTSIEARPVAPPSLTATVETQTVVKKFEEVDVQTSKEAQQDSVSPPPVSVPPPTPPPPSPPIQQEDIPQPESSSSSSEYPHLSPAAPPIQEEYLSSRKPVITYHFQPKVDPSEAEMRLRREVQGKFESRRKWIPAESISDRSDLTVQTFDTASTGSDPDMPPVALLRSGDSNLDRQIRKMWMIEKDKRGSLWSTFSLDSNTHGSAESGSGSERAGHSVTRESVESDESFYYLAGEDDDINLSSSLLLHSDSSDDDDEDNDRVSYYVGRVDYHDLYVDENTDAVSHTTSSTLDMSFYEMNPDSMLGQGDGPAIGDNGEQAIAGDFGRIVQKLLKSDFAKVDTSDVFDDSDDESV